MSPAEQGPSREKGGGPGEERGGGVSGSRCTGGGGQGHWAPLRPLERLPSAPHPGLIDLKRSSILEGKTTAIANCFRSQGNTKKRLEVV